MYFKNILFFYLILTLPILAEIPRIEGHYNTNYFEGVSHLRLKMPESGLSAEPFLGNLDEIQINSHIFRGLKTEQIPLEVSSNNFLSFINLLTTSTFEDGAISNMHFANSHISARHFLNKSITEEKLEDNLIFGLEKLSPITMGDVRLNNDNEFFVQGILGYNIETNMPSLTFNYLAFENIGDGKFLFIDSAGDGDMRSSVYGIDTENEYTKLNKSRSYVKGTLRLKQKLSTTNVPPLSSDWLRLGMTIDADTNKQHIIFQNNNLTPALIEPGDSDMHSVYWARNQHTTLLVNEDGDWLDINNEITTNRSEAIPRYPYHVDNALNSIFYGGIYFQYHDTNDLSGFNEKYLFLTTNSTDIAYAPAFEFSETTVDTNSNMHTMYWANSNPNLLNWAGSNVFISASPMRFPPFTSDKIIDGTVNSNNLFSRINFITRSNPFTAAFSNAFINAIDISKFEDNLVFNVPENQLAGNVIDSIFKNELISIYINDNLFGVDIVGNVNLEGAVLKLVTDGENFVFDTESSGTEIIETISIDELDDVQVGLSPDENDLLIFDSNVNEWITSNNIELNIVNSPNIFLDIVDINSLDELQLITYDNLTNYFIFPDDTDDIIRGYSNTIWVAQPPAVITNVFVDGDGHKYTVQNTADFIEGVVNETFLIFDNENMQIFFDEIPVDSAPTNIIEFKTMHTNENKIFYVKNGDPGFHHMVYHTVRVDDPNIGVLLMQSENDTFTSLSIDEHNNIMITPNFDINNARFELMEDLNFYTNFVSSLNNLGHNRIGSGPNYGLGTPRNNLQIKSANTNHITISTNTNNEIIISGNFDMFPPGYRPISIYSEFRNPTSETIETTNVTTIARSDGKTVKLDLTEDINLIKFDETYPTNGITIISMWLNYNENSIIWDDNINIIGSPLVDDDYNLITFTRFRDEPWVGDVQYITQFN